MNADWKVEKAQYAEFNVPTCGKIAVWQLCRERQPFWNSHEWPEFDMFGSMPWCWFPWHKLLPRLTPKNCCIVYSLNLTTEIGKSRHWTSVFFCRCASNARFAEDQPKKEFHKTTKDIAQMNADWKVEKAQYAELNVPTCGKIAVCQLCRERQPFWNSHDGLNLTCLDQCHGVGSHGTSSSQGWRQRIVIKSTV